jgi:demethylphylloquinol methyltransferase
MSQAETTTDVQSLFNRIAPVYDQLNQSLSLGLHQVWKLMTVKWADPKPGSTALDLCCGSGDITQLLAHRVGKTGLTVGVDFSAELLAIARDRARSQQPNHPIEWIEADVLALPFSDQQFDAITMGYGLRNVANIPSCLAEIYRVLKPGAKAAILDFNHSTNPYVTGFQQWYLDTWVVPTAQKMGLTDEYAYIMPSLERFPTGDEQIRLAQAVGFEIATHYEIALGTMGVLVLQKEDESNV